MHLCYSAFSVCLLVTAILSFSTADYELRPLKLGAEVLGVDLRKHVNDSLLFARLKQDAHRHRLLLFRNQGELPADTFMALSEHFGHVYHEPFTTQTKDLKNHQKAPMPAIMRISNDVNEGFKGVGTSGWHIDGAYKDTPYAFLLFNSVKAPVKGDTKFAGFKEVLGSMQSEKLEKWNRIWSVNTRKVLGEHIFEIHPLLYNHPITNETVLCIHLGYMKGAIYDDGVHEKRFLTPTELAALKKEITHEFNKNNERLVYSHKWKDGDVVIIDNLQVAHLASKESQMPSNEVGLRILHRIAVKGIQKPQKHTETT